MRNLNVVIMDIFLILLLYHTFCNLENPRKLSNSRARKIEPRRKLRELAKIASELQRAAFGIPLGSEPSFGGVGVDVGVLWGKIEFVISFWGWVEYIEGPRTRGVHFGDSGPGPVPHADFGDA